MRIAKDITDVKLIDLHNYCMVTGAEVDVDKMELVIMEVDNRNEDFT